MKNDTYQSAVMLGLAIGDALGQPFEFNTYEFIRDSGWNGEFQNGITWRSLKIGQYTDDTKMSMCISNSLLEHKGFNPEDIGKRYVEWVASGDLRGIGSRCASSIGNLANGISYLESGKKEKARAKPSFRRTGSKDFGITTDFCGNGTVMRVAPIGVFFRNDLEQLEKVAKEEANITHHHPDARDTSYALSYFIAKILNEENPDIYKIFEEVLNLKYEYDHVPTLLKAMFSLFPLKSYLNENYYNFESGAVINFQYANPEISKIFQDVIALGVRGTAHETFATAVFCFLATNTYKDAVNIAIRLGGDCDTRGALVGALAGALYGLEGIPKKYIDKVEDSEKLQEIDKQLYLNR